MKIKNLRHCSIKICPRLASSDGKYRKKKGGQKEDEAVPMLTSVSTFFPSSHDLMDQNAVKVFNL